MPEALDLVRRYLEAWNESDPDIRRAELETVWADDGSYSIHSRPSPATTRSRR